MELPLGLGPKFRLLSTVALLSGLGVLAAFGSHMTSRQSSPDIFFATITCPDLQLRFWNASNGTLRQKFRLVSQLPAIANLPCMVLPFPVFSLLLLLLVGIEPNPGPHLATDFPVSASSQPVIASANICGLRSKVNNLQVEYLASYNLAAIALQETKLPPSCKDPSLSLPDYTLFRKDRNGSGGGVALYLQNSLNP